MANIVNIEKVIDGSSVVVIKVDIVGDGSGEESIVIYDTSTFLNTTARKKITQMQYCLNGFSAALIWDGTVPKQIVTLVENFYEHPNFEWFGGINNSKVTVPNGDISIVTSGLGAGDRGDLVLEIRCQEVPIGER